jgi:hypothetical protein
MTPYIIHCCPGTGGLFLISVFAQILGYNVKSNFSQTGHAHDMGNGNWAGAPGVCLVGDHWGMNYRPAYPLYYTHCIPEHFLKNNPKIKMVLVDTDPVDYKKVTELYVKKAWPKLWTEEEYNKWAGPDYPPYSHDNIETSSIIQNDLINDLEVDIVKKWHDQNRCVPADAKINFRTIMGIDNLDLIDAICLITNLTLSADKKESLQQYVSVYQTLNLCLYFSEYNQ